MTFPEQAARKVLAYIEICKINQWEPELAAIENIIQHYTTEEAYFRTYGHYPSNPQI